MTNIVFPYKTTYQTLSDHDGRWLLSHFREAADTRTTTFTLFVLSLRKSFFAKCSSRGNITINVGKVVPLCYMEKWDLRDSNPAPTGYEPVALT